MSDTLSPAEDRPHILTAEVMQALYAAIRAQVEASGITTGSMLIILRTSVGTEIRHNGCNCAQCQTSFRKAVQAVTAQPPTAARH